MQEHARADTRPSTCAHACKSRHTPEEPNDPQDARACKSAHACKSIQVIPRTHARARADTRPSTCAHTQEHMHTRIQRLLFRTFSLEHVVGVSGKNTPEAMSRTIAELLEPLQWPDAADEIVELNQNADGVEVITVSAVEKNWGLVCALSKGLDFELPTTKNLEAAISLMDTSRQLKLTKHSTLAGRRSWYRYEAEKIHCLLSYVARLCRRSDNSKSVKIAVLKQMRRQCKGITDSHTQ